MKIKPYTGHQNLDENLNPRYWRNMDKAQVHVWKSFIHEVYPNLRRHYPEKVTCKPGTVTLLPHRYYKIYTRDDTPAKGAWYIGDAIEDAAHSSLSRGDAYGHED